MMIQLALGIMNPLVMIGVAMVIAAEKLLPRPAIVTRLVGISATIAGIVALVSSRLSCLADLKENAKLESSARLQPGGGRRG